MTLFCSLVTGIILVAMTLICLILSENVIYHNHRQSFQSDLNSVLSYLENQTVISCQWLSKAEGGGRLYLNLYDNGAPLLYNSLPEEEFRSGLMDMVRETAIEEYGLDVLLPSSNSVLYRSVDFLMKDERGKEYYAAAAVFPKQGGSLSMTAVYPLSERERQISTQRLIFAGIDLFGILALTLFAWKFTGRMLYPLEESHRKQAQFVAAASHELRSPLAVMLSNLSAMKKAEPEQRERFEENIRAEGNRMSRLIDDMLTLASADNRSWSIAREPTEADTLALNLYERYLGPAKERGLRLEISLPEELLPRYQWDENRVEQALSVLLSNALSYTPPGGTICISLTCQAGKKALFAIQDNGPGIPDSEKEKIFQRFYRVDPSRRDREHFGLGLCVAREIAELHNGKLWVEDAPGGGARFCLLLP